MNRTCGECANCIQTEYGYSSWTVLGIEWECAFDKNPAFPKEDAEREDVRLANECPDYREGEPKYYALED